MRVVWYWWGFEVYVDAAVIDPLITAVQSGEQSLRALLDRYKLGWVVELVRVLLSWGAASLRAMKATCAGRGWILTVPWVITWAHIKCR
jgi:hypothetical protein